MITMTEIQIFKIGVNSKIDKWFLCNMLQESRTLEMNNVQDGTWHGRGDTICIGGFNEGSKPIFDLHPPPIVSIKSIDESGMDQSKYASNLP